VCVYIYTYKSTPDYQAQWPRETRPRRSPAPLQLALVLWFSRSPPPPQILLSYAAHEPVVLHMNEPRQMSMSHVTYQWVTSHINGSRYISISHVTYWRVTSHIDKSRYILTSHVTYQWVTSHIDESRHISISHATRAHDFTFVYLNFSSLATWYFNCDVVL